MYLGNNCVHKFCRIGKGVARVFRKTRMDNDLKKMMK